jgi:hypothetical protein
MESVGSRLLAWVLGLGVVLSLLGLLVATGESIRHPDIAAPLPEAAQPEVPIKQAPEDNTYRDPVLPAWMAQ